MSVDPQPTLPPEVTLLPLRPAELAAANEPSLSWLWRGFLAAHKVTTLIGPPKSSGKTTLLSVLLARFAQGGQLAGLPVSPARVLVVSEESTADWDARCRRLGIGPNVQFLCRPFQGARPTEEQWFRLIADLEALQRREPLDVIVFDTLATLLPGYAETCAPKLLDCLLPLQGLASLGPGVGGAGVWGPAVWLFHHPAKGKQADGQAGRGTIALPAIADIVMEMSCCRRARSRDRRRRICGYSRYEETPRHLIVELSADGADYLAGTDAAGTPLVKTWDEIHYILDRAGDKLSLREILERWHNEEQDPPDRSTLSRWLKRATQQGMVRRDGNGRALDSYRYWLPGREPLLFPGRNASAAEQQAWRERCQAHANGLLKLPESA